MLTDGTLPFIRSRLRARPQTRCVQAVWSPRKIALKIRCRTDDKCSLASSTDSSEWLKGKSIKSVLAEFLPNGGAALVENTSRLKTLWKLEQRFEALKQGEMCKKVVSRYVAIKK